jgi:hypothetical protein
VPNSQQTKQTKQEEKKTTARQRLGRRGTEEVGHKRRKRAEKKEVKHHTKAMEHQVHCLTQRIEDKVRRGDSEGWPPLLPPVRRSQRWGLRFIGRYKGASLLSSSLYADMFKKKKIDKYIMFSQIIKDFHPDLNGNALLIIIY